MLIDKIVFTETYVQTLVLFTNDFRKILAPDYKQ